MYKTDMLNVQLHLQGVNYLPRLHTDWFKYRVSQQSCVMCGIPCQVCALVYGIWLLAITIERGHRACFSGLLQLAIA